ncbi:MAG: asparaginase domain-containing protein [Phycisphaerales bacterium JB039]
MRRITILTTGGTIEKTYDEFTGELANQRSIVRRMLKRLRLDDTDITVTELMSKDSQDLTDDDRAEILAAVGSALAAQPAPTAILILHGTDTLAVTGELLLRELPELPVPIILTGAMRPFLMTRSDGVQNLTESIFAAGVLPPGVWCVFHGKALPFPGVVKDRSRGTFVGAEESRE